MEVGISGQECTAAKKLTSINHMTVEEYYQVGLHRFACYMSPLHNKCKNQLDAGPFWALMVFENVGETATLREKTICVPRPCTARIVMLQPADKNF